MVFSKSKISTFCTNPPHFFGATESLLGKKIKETAPAENGLKPPALYDCCRRYIWMLSWLRSAAREEALTYRIERLNFLRIQIDLFFGLVEIFT